MIFYRMSLAPAKSDGLLGPKLGQGCGMASFPSIEVRKASRRRRRVTRKVRGDGIFQEGDAEIPHAFAPASE